ncbi:hypothetical protein Nepgr_017188 [Nepenthes gracilis]|uniref:Glycosyltransferase family 92 protein n=1 Tax=Nepenthes gracilis TaxID=150966 RepID=A0AAD3SRY7_NEPGR|nr:hypothetical protein Nepgr_017188 [Nepenthes gracilis]
MDTRKRKRILRPLLQLSLRAQYLSMRRLLLCLSFFLFLFFMSHHFRVEPVGSWPTRIVPSLSVLSSSASNSIQDLTGSRMLPELRVENTVLFPNSILVILRMDRNRRRRRLGKGMDCVYRRLFNNSDKSNWVEEMNYSHRDFARRPILSADEYDEFRWIVWCPSPPKNYLAAVALRWHHQSHVVDQNWAERGPTRTARSWDMVAYEAALEGENRDKIAVFVKGLNLRPDRESDPTKFSCRFECGNSEKSESFVLTSKAITAAQEVVICPLPSLVRMNLGKFEGFRVTIVMTSDVHGRRKLQQLVPSVAKIHEIKSSEKKGNRGEHKHELCACTMVWNQASTIKEWIIYHAWLGVQRWFIYDNNSNDDLKNVIAELDEGNYNVTRHVWPWIKSQEAGFSHCALRARAECSWVAFFDVDEFFYFPPPKHRGDGGGAAYPGQNSYARLVAKFSSSTVIAEIRTLCYSFGPSGLSSPPARGLTLGYTCRLQSPERHKSIVRPDAIDDTLLNAVHHFRLRKGFRYLNLPPGTALINHYKYQVWEVFKAKFYRRVSTYVADWRENQNEGSRDRAPGLGTEAIEPTDWRLKFCEVWDTGLRDFVLTNLADPSTGLLPWEIPSLQ